MLLFPVCRKSFLLFHERSIDRSSYISDVVQSSFASVEYHLYSKRRASEKVFDNSVFRKSNGPFIPVYTILVLYAFSTLTIANKGVCCPFKLARILASHEFSPFKRLSQVH